MLEIAKEASAASKAVAAAATELQTVRAESQSIQV
jgi:hypothetical protein